MIKFSPATSIKPCLHIAICCIEEHLTTSDWVTISLSYMPFILVNLRQLRYSYILTGLQEDIAPQGSKLHIIINTQIFKILSRFNPWKFW